MSGGSWCDERASNRAATVTPPLVTVCSRLRFTQLFVVLLELIEYEGLGIDSEVK